ncbi:hypothetical protein A2635_02425 [Candidatus Peribacteria bacterium RIFCSPHIGHO2_01_FULL_51_9]|nr:MAG: hypothetical protein A2635_02425 [Candidatus Peribacteria bacterium RIFCSPHIGHO2_01_FULL_51_9]
MHVQHFEKGVKYSDRELIILARKIGKLATYCKRIKDESSSIRIEVERRETQKKADQVKMCVTVSLPHKILCAESRQETPVEALDRCIEKLEPQVKKYKELHGGDRMGK